MTGLQKNVIRLAALTAAVVGLMIPVTVSPNQGLSTNEACADGGCCRELMSVCVKDGQSTTHYYQPSDGVCTSVRN